MRIFGFIFCVMVAFAPRAQAAQALAEDYQEKPFVEVAILDKITARVKQVIIAVGEDFTEARLQLRVDRCADTPPEFTPEAVAFVHVSEKKVDEETSVFSGWMFASSPGLSAVEHPVYDIWLIACHLDRP